MWLLIIFTKCHKGQSYLKSQKNWFGQKSQTHGLEWIGFLVIDAKLEALQNPTLVIHFEW